MVIYNMRAKRAAYNLISNNCQNFALLMLDAIQIGAHREFATSFAIYQRASAPGSIKELFLPEDETVQAAPGADAQGQTVVQHAQQVMDENTTKLDNHHCHY
jgi:hypothetical protein